MIFLNNFYKIPSGTNPSLFANENKSMNFFVFNSQTKQYNINKDKIFRCVNTMKIYPYNAVVQLSNNKLCVCFDDNMSVVYEEKVNK